VSLNIQGLPPHHRITCLLKALRMASSAVERVPHECTTSRARVWLDYGAIIPGGSQADSTGLPLALGSAPGLPWRPQETDKAREMGFLIKRHSGLTPSLNPA
jgi:hypothetical protein